MPIRSVLYDAARKQWSAYGLYALLGLIGLLMAVWATWLNVSSAWANNGSGSALGASVAETSIPSLPAFTPMLAEASLSRQANIYTEFPVRPRVDIVRYTVQLGDSVFGIAGNFDIKPETLLMGNYSVLNDNPHLLKPGQELNILPVDGGYMGR